MAEQAVKEPTMEEILASIRQIISEGGEPENEAGNANAAAPELTEVAHDNSADEAFDVSELLGDQDNQAETGSDDHLLSVDELLSSDDLAFGDIDDVDGLNIDDIAVPSLSEDVSAEPQVELESAFDDGIDNMNDLDSLLGEVDDIATSSTSVAQTNAQPVMSEPAPAPVAPAAPVEPAPVAAAAAAATAPVAGISVAGNSALEGLVSELMKPVIKEWIDTNLPNIVERRVEAEINQIAAKVISALRD